jgi:choline dehydrogenase
VIREVVAQAPFDEYRGQELEPGAQISSVDDIDAWMRKTVNVSHHLSGSCKMGSADDPLAVVGPDLRVHGLQRLRVIDASIAPTVPTGNTHATTIAIGEKGADLIKSEAS